MAALLCFYTYIQNDYSRVRNKKQVIYNAKKSINEEILTNLPPYCILKYQYIYQKISNQNKKQVVFYLVGVS